MTPELFSQAVSASDTRAPSAARLAAEAFFAPLPVNANEPAQPVVPVFRHKKAVEREAAQQASGVEAQGTAQTVRAPRVFRLDAGKAVAGSLVVDAVTEQAEVPNPRAVIDDVVTEESAAPTRRLPRKKARRRHGEVTIIRPIATAQEQAPAPVEEPHSDGALTGKQQHLAEDWPRYPAMLKQLRLLRAQADKVKRAEATAALRWIKASIREHGITARELGLGNGRR